MKFYVLILSTLVLLAATAIVNLNAAETNNNGSFENPFPNSKVRL